MSRQVIVFLYNRLKNEQKQRLETEEQTSTMVTYMGKTISQLVIFFIFVI